MMLGSAPKRRFQVSCSKRITSGASGSKSSAARHRPRAGLTPNVSQRSPSTYAPWRNRPSSGNAARLGSMFNALSKSPERSLQSSKSDHEMFLPSRRGFCCLSAPSSTRHIATRRSGYSYGRGWMRTPFTTANVAVPTPTPSTSATRTVAVKPRSLRNERRAKRTSWRRLSTNGIARRSR